MAFPGPKVHRVSRRKLGRGQHPQYAQATATLTESGTTLTITFNVPVVVSGVIPTTSAGSITRVSQTVVSPTVVTQTWSAAITGTGVMTLPAGSPITTYQGGGCAAATATF